MKLYLSGAKFFMGEQKSPYQSIGGIMSNTPVPSGRLNLLFSDVSAYSKMTGSKDCMAFFLFNDSSESMMNVKISQIISHDPECDFFWGAVCPTSGEIIQMESIGSRKDEPYNVEWFQPTTIREHANCVVSTAGHPGDVVSLFDVEFLLTGSTVESVVDDIAKKFKKNEDFYVEKISSNSFYIERLEVQNTNEEIELITPGNASLVTNFFSGFEDGTTLVMEELEPKKAIGFWVKRVVKEISNCEVEGCEFLNCKENTKETLEVIFSYD